MADTIRDLLITYTQPEAHVNKIYLPEIRNSGNKIKRLLKKGEYMSSITFSEKALAFIFKNIGKNNVYAVTFCSYIGNAYSELGEFGKALIYFEKAQNILSKLKNKIPFDEAALYNNIATCYSKRTRLISSNYHNKEEVNKAILNYKKSLNIYLKLYGENNKVVADLFNNLGIISTRIKKFDTAREYLFRSNEIYCKLYGNSCLPVSISLFNQAFYYKGIKNYRKAIESANRSLTILLKLKGLENFRTKRYNFLSLIYLEVRDYKKSLEFNDLEVSSIRKHFDSETNDFSNADANLTILEALSTRADINRSMYKDTGNKEYLLNAFDNYTKVIELLDILRLQYFYEDSKNILTVKSVSLYERSIEVCIELFKIYKDEKYINEAFEYSQKSKSLSLIENIKDYDAKLSANIPPVILKQETNLKKKISDLEKLLHEENKNPGKSLLNTEKLRNQLFNLKQKFETLIKKLEREFPEYFNLKYDFKPASADEIKKQIPEDTMVIEYFLGDENIFAFVFTGSKYYVSHISKSKSFDNKIKTYRNLLTQNTGIMDESAVTKFKELSYYLYKVLLKDILESHINLHSKSREGNIPVKNILIVPDNELNFIPFDSLITHNHNNVVSFKELPYLIKYFNIIFSYSIILYLKSINETKKKNILNILAFAPVFKDHNGKSKYSLTENFRNSLSPLNYNQKEVKEISKNFSGRYYFDKEAVKEKFVKNKKQFSILHFATHSVVDYEDPMYSKIVFSKSGKETDEGFLHTYEIYTLNSKYDLVVLSACNTGFGRMIRGEGIMSVARAFASSGSKNIVMSLWQVNDKSTSVIMKMFYRNIANGEKVGEALRNAKLKYLKNSDELKAMPFYWSPFISFGDNNSLVKA